MNIQLYFLIYLSLYRLAVIAAGTICIMLGYRMFCKGLWPESNTHASEMMAEIKGVKFFLKNAAPGTFFALFGAIIISTMIVLGSPEYTRETLNNISSEGEQIKGTQAESLNTIISQKKETLRGEDDSAQRYVYYYKLGMAYEKQERIKQAVENYTAALKMASKAMNNLAWLHYRLGEDSDDALSLAKMAIRFNSEDANYWDTLAKILFKIGNYQEALNAKQKASELNPKFSDNIEKFKEAVE
jgi:tetratricopeptide (TPR) repeat protein